MILQGFTKQGPVKTGNDIADLCQHTTSFSIMLGPLIKGLMKQSLHGVHNAISWYHAMLIVSKFKMGAKGNGTLVSRTNIS